MRQRGKTMDFLLSNTERRKQALDIFTRVLAAAPDSLIKSLTGQEYAKHAIDGAKELETYLFTESTEKPKK